MEANTKIGKIAKANPVSVSPSTSARAAMRLLESSNLSLIPVIDDDRLVGIVTEDHLKKAKDLDSVKVVMHRPLFVEKGKSVDYAIKYIMKHGINRVPIVESGIGMRCIGIVSASELLKAKKSMQK